MIKICKNPTFNNVLNSINYNRSLKKNSKLEDLVSSILKDVKSNGDIALKKYTQKYDNVNIHTFKATDKDFYEAEIKVSNELKESIKIAYNNIKSFHQKQIQKESKIETSEGVFCWRRNIPIEKIGFYIPGGTAPLLSTVLMLGIPGKLAGCKNIIICTPPNKSGNIHHSILYTAKYLGINSVYKLGGVQAIAAMTYGTESIPAVYKIFGPGNSYVTKAKEIVCYKENISIDLPAGPSELVIIADDTANPNYVASDLLSQLEHDPESYAIIITTINNNDWIKSVQKKIRNQFIFLNKRKNIVKQSIKNSSIIVLSSLEECFLLVNKIAPEHLIINCRNANSFWFNKVINAGSVFLGNYSPVSAGDYATGTNHVLPTNGNAKYYSGISIDSFVRKITFQNISKEGLKNLSKYINILSSEEGLFAHKKSINIRLT
ncbi:histidinol dehydrogenase [Blattabacterium cuenoti]|uniref:histidinol dehydrogenase n=1 Tax=Blattabacterium cuenoti TaxID=1653831 RepID=UPI00163B8443|nr:histidinol dehydrogenase [Blattabacterium cuenoti]